MNSTQGPTSVLQADYAVEIDLTLYGLDVIFRTAYAYTDRCFLWLEHASDGQIRVSFKAKEKSDGIEGIAGDFLNSLIDFAVRREVTKETGQVRDLLVSAALGEALKGGRQ